ncbi:MAG: hypothetical protein QF690_00595 [Anaerolineales bacterium]|nr:hypothetical protein [Anaerolineales bacterium]
MSLDRSHVKSITDRVCRRFPELKGISPNVRIQATPKSGRNSKSGQRENNRFLLTFRGSATLPGGKSMQRVVRVIANSKGKVLKIALSK